MSTSGPRIVDELRRAFDATFAAEPPRRVEHVDLIALRAGARSYAVRVSEIGGVVPFGGVTPLPCDEPSMVGLAAVRGAPLPVYDLASLLGEAPALAPRWMLLSARATRVALAFDEIEAYVRMPLGQVGEVVRHGEAARAVISLEAVLERLAKRLGYPTKEK